MKSVQLAYHGEFMIHGSSTLLQSRPERYLGIPTDQLPPKLRVKRLLGAQTSEATDPPVESICERTKLRRQSHRQPTQTQTPARTPVVPKTQSAEPNRKWKSWAEIDVAHERYCAQRALGMAAADVEDSR